MLELFYSVYLSMCKDVNVSLF